MKISKLLFKIYFLFILKYKSNKRKK